MKASYRNKLLVVLLFLLGTSAGKIFAQDTETPPTLLELKYFLPENKIPFIQVITKKKVGRKFEPVVAVPVNIYLAAVSDSNLLGKVTTDKNGWARIGIPPSLKTAWDALDEFTLVARSVPAANEDEIESELTIRKAILVIDTANDDGARTVSAQLKEKKGAEWVAVPEIEMKLKIRRLLGNLTVGDEEVFTSDESGTASSSFVKDSIPGDEKGNIVLLARVEDNDIYGNLSVEKTVPWGKPTVKQAYSWPRTLWSTGTRAPYWLMVIAFSIVILVWGTLLYLVQQMFKVKRMGREIDRKLTAQAAGAKE